MRRARWRRSPLDRWIERIAASRSVAIGSAAAIALLIRPGGFLPTLGLFVLAAVICLAARQQLELTRQLGAIESSHQSMIGGLWSLLGLLGRPGRPLPQLTGGAMDVRAAAALVDLVARTRPAVVVELGSGATTVLLGLCGASSGGSMELWSLEDDPAFSEQAQRLVADHAIPRCRILTAPLVDQAVEGWRGRWYSPDAVARLPDQIDLLVVDGPANVAQRDTRYPAYPLLRSRLRPGSSVFVHDTDREDEASMVTSWTTHGQLRQEASGSRFIVLRHA